LKSHYSPKALQATSQLYSTNIDDDDDAGSLPESRFIGFYAT